VASNTAKAKYIRISPFKVRRIANEIVRKNVLEAEAYLSVLPNKGALALKKVIHSARTNFMSKNTDIDEENLIVNKVLIDSGSTYKRYHPISRGRAQSILKRTCHIFVEVGAKEIEPVEKTKKGTEEKDTKKVKSPKPKSETKKGAK
jgi:large subunit ribosomal protein L22